MTVFGVKVRIWLRGLISAAVSGASGGVANGLAAMGIAPDTFNLQAGATNVLKLAALAALASGAIGVANYLKQSPLPPEET